MARTTSARGANRAKLIAAAYEVLTTVGYEATTIKAVAHAAGVAPGLIHYYFTSKEELLIAVVEDAATRYAEDMRQLSTSAAPDQLAFAAIAARKSRVEREPDRERLRFELIMLGLRHPAMRPAVARVFAVGRNSVARMLPQIGVPHDDGLAAAFLALFEGVAMQQLADPEFDLDAAYRAIERLVRLAIAAAPIAAPTA